MSAGRIVQGQCVLDADALNITLSYLQPDSSVGADGASYMWYWFKASSTQLGRVVLKNDTVIRNELYTFSLPSCDYQPSITGLPADFDYTILGALFAFAFSIVVGLWLFGKSAGSIVNIFKPK